MLTNDRYARVATPADAVGAAAEGSKEPGRGTLTVNSAAPDDKRFFDVFSRDEVAKAQEWVAEADARWITLSQRSGTTATEQRVTVTAARNHPAATGTIRVFNAVHGAKTGDPVATFTVEAERAAVDLRRGRAGAPGGQRIRGPGGRALLRERARRRREPVGPP